METASPQVGGAATNHKLLERRDIAPTWVYYDAHSYASNYLSLSVADGCRFLPPSLTMSDLTGKKADHQPLRH